MRSWKQKIDWDKRKSGGGDGGLRKQRRECRERERWRLQVTVLTVSYNCLKYELLTEWEHNCTPVYFQFLINIAMLIEKQKKTKKIAKLFQAFGKKTSSNQSPIWLLTIFRLYVKHEVGSIPHIGCGGVQSQEKRKTVDCGRQVQGTRQSVRLWNCVSGAGIKATRL